MHKINDKNRELSHFSHRLWIWSRIAFKYCIILPYYLILLCDFLLFFCHNYDWKCKCKMHWQSENTIILCNIVVYRDCVINMLSKDTKIIDFAHRFIYLWSNRIGIQIEYLQYWLNEKTNIPIRPGNSRQEVPSIGMSILT